MSIGRGRDQGKKTSKRSLLANMTAEERYHLQQQEQQQQRGKMKERSQTGVASIGNSNAFAEVYMGCGAFVLCFYVLFRFAWYCLGLVWFLFS
jgi:hypothetical protein